MNTGVFLRSASVPGDAAPEMEEIGVCPEAVGIMAPKMRHFVFMVRGVDPRAANILKQEMLAVGGEAAISYHTLCDLSRPTDCLISGTERQFSIARTKLAMQPFGLSGLAGDIEAAMRNTSFRGERRFGALGTGDRTLVMGVLNVTPDSFSGDGTTDPSAAIDRGVAMAAHGADIIDVGGESTRPGAVPPGPDEENVRVVPVIRALADKVNVPISIDTREPSVAEAALKAGASIVNLVGGIRCHTMAGLLARTGAPVILMHMQGQPDTMQDRPEYRDVMDDIISDLRCQISQALDAGIKPENIAVDPGIGFGKTVDHNLEILRRLGEMGVLGLPVVMGMSRKSFIGKILDAGVRERLEGSLVTAALASAGGADIIRTHDVAETVRALRVADAVSGRGT